MRQRQLLTTVPILSEASVYEARKVTRDEAERLGFAPQAVGELLLVASELSNNVARHAGRGELRLRRVDDARGVGIEVAAWDEGPPIADFTAALQDGWSSGAPVDPTKLLRRKGIGSGLGAVQRLSDELRYEVLPRGKEICAVRFVVPLRHR